MFIRNYFKIKFVSQIRNNDWVVENDVYESCDVNLRDIRLSQISLLLVFKLSITTKVFITLFILIHIK